MELTSPILKILKVFFKPNEQGRRHGLPNCVHPPLHFIKDDGVLYPTLLILLSLCTCSPYLTISMYLLSVGLLLLVEVVPVLILHGVPEPVRHQALRRKFCYR